MEHLIEFDWDDFDEDDDSWSILYVSVDGKPWQLAYSHYGTEDEEEIRRIVNGNKQCHRGAVYIP